MQREEYDIQCQSGIIFLQALSPQLEALKRSMKGAEKEKKESADDAKPERALVEARVYLTGALFKMDHHPMEVRV